MAGPSITFLLVLMNFLMNRKTFFFVKLPAADFTFKGQLFHYVCTIRKVLLEKVFPTPKSIVWFGIGLLTNAFFQRYSPSKEPF